MKDQILEKIYKIISETSGVETAKIFYNLESDRVITYKQGGEKYLITIDQL